MSPLTVVQVQTPLLHVSWYVQGPPQPQLFGSEAEPVHCPLQHTMPVPQAVPFCTAAHVLFAGLQVWQVGQTTGSHAPVMRLQVVQAGQSLLM
jgi:hypothetical protein